MFGHAFGDVHDFILVQERGFQVDLIVTVETGNHQQLFEQLRRLRQSEEFARMNAARHEVVARAFRSGAGQHRRFNVDEALRVQVTANAHSDLVTQAQVALHGRTAQVDNAVSQANVFADVFVVDLERRRSGSVQDFDFFGKDFDFAGNHFVVDCTFGTVAYAAGNAQNVFVAGGIGSGKCFRSVRVDNDLNDAFTVAQVDKNHTAVVTSAVYPAFDGNGLV